MLLVEFLLGQDGFGALQFVPVVVEAAVVSPVAAAAAAVVVVAAAAAVARFAVLLPETKRNLVIINGFGHR